MGVYITSDVDLRKSTYEYLINFSWKVVSWQSKLQKCVVFSTNKDGDIEVS